MASRRIEDLSPRLRELYFKFDEKMKALGINYAITCTARSVLEQMAIFVQGRLGLEEVNSFRKHAGLASIGQSENRKVTWTLNSKHLTNLLDDKLDNDFSEAFDIVILKDKRAVWDIKVDVNNDLIPDYKQAGEVGESVGLRWGGRFSSPDPPHFEV